MRQTLEKSAKNFWLVPASHISLGETITSLRIVKLSMRAAILMVLPTTPFFDRFMHPTFPTNTSPVCSAMAISSMGQAFYWWYRALTPTC